jgi:heparan-alpha-glucosaminide N-acetyltransferase
MNKYDNISDFVIIIFFFLGMNSILLYMGHELLHNNFPINWHVAPVHRNLLLVDTYGTVVWLVVAFYCYHKSIFFVI